MKITHTNGKSYRSGFLPFVHSISSNVHGGHSIAAPNKAHWYQSTESLPDLIGIACGQICKNDNMFSLLEFRTP